MLLQRQLDHLLVHFLLQRVLVAPFDSALGSKARNGAGGSLGEGNAMQSGRRSRHTGFCRFHVSRIERRELIIRPTMKKEAKGCVVRREVSD
jgi:hypothetical protein